MKSVTIIIIAVSMITASIFAAHIPMLWVPFIGALVIMSAAIYGLRIINKNIIIKEAVQGIGSVNSFTASVKETEKLAADFIDGTIDGSVLEDKLEILQSRFEKTGDKLREELGMKLYTERVIKYAGAERLMNRALSAALDGYPEEARANCRKAIPILQSLYEELEKDNIINKK